MSPHRRTEEELDELQRQAKLASLEAEATLEEVNKSEPSVRRLISDLVARRVTNGFGQAYEITMIKKTV